MARLWLAGGWSGANFDQASQRPNASLRAEESTAFALWPKAFAHCRQRVRALGPTRSRAWTN
eukprot:4442530-Pleurochrysis_carterae.AAC.1